MPTMKGRAAGSALVQLQAQEAHPDLEQLQSPANHSTAGQAACFAAALHACIA